MIIGILINSLILMAILMYIGYYLRNKGILNDDGKLALTFLLVNITTPAMVINAMNIDFSVDYERGILKPIAEEEINGEYDTEEYTE